MHPDRRLSDLLGMIYDASLDAARWQDVVAGIADFIPGAFVNLFSQDATRKSAQAFFTHGIEQAWLELYFQKYMPINPLFPAMLFFEPGRILTEEDILPRSEFVETRFYKEWVRPQGLVESMASVLEKSAVSVAGIAVGLNARQSPITDAARERLSLIIPHIRRAQFIGKVIDLKRVEALALADVVDGLSSGVLLVAADGRIVHANASALVMLSDGALMRDDGGKLSFLDAEADAALRRTWSGGENDAPDARMSVPLLDRERTHHVAHVLPLTGGARRQAGHSYNAVVAIFVSRATLAEQHPLESLAKAYRLTPTEMRVLMTIVHVGGTPEAAPILGIAETTVKTHLAHIFAKTATSRQADLVKLVAGHLSPLA